MYLRARRPLARSQLQALALLERAWRSQVGAQRFCAIGSGPCTAGRLSSHPLPSRRDCARRMQQIQSRGASLAAVRVRRLCAGCEAEHAGSPQRAAIAVGASEACSMVCLTIALPALMRARHCLLKSEHLLTASPACFVEPTHAAWAQHSWWDKPRLGTVDVEVLLVVCLAQEHTAVCALVAVRGELGLAAAWPLSCGGSGW